MAVPKRRLLLGTKKGLTNLLKVDFKIVSRELGKLKGVIFIAGQLGNASERFS